MAFGALADTGTAICMEKFMQNANADGTPKILYTGVDLHEHAQSGR